MAEAGDGDLEVIVIIRARMSMVSPEYEVQRGISEQELAFKREC
jgi:hypothetical protein